MVECEIKLSRNVSWVPKILYHKLNFYVAYFLDELLGFLCKLCLSVQADDVRVFVCISMYSSKSFITTQQHQSTAEYMSLLKFLSLIHFVKIIPHPYIAINWNFQFFIDKTYYYIFGPKICSYIDFRKIHFHLLLFVILLLYQWSSIRFTVRLYHNALHGVYAASMF